MKKKVFISGSISIKNLTNKIINSIDNIINQNLEVLIGDADGIDSLIQSYLSSKNYFNVTVYSITSTPRYFANKKFNFKYIPVSFDIKKERERQQEKDKMMTLDSDFSFIIWDSKSKGSYGNVLRALENNKKIKLYLFSNDEFLEANKITKKDIEYIYRMNNGYTASEIVDYLKENIQLNIFKKTQDLNKYLMDKNILKKENSNYMPISNNNLFILEKYQGKIKGVKFKNEFIDWIEEELKSSNLSTQLKLF